jgi:hypothetical protein
MRVTGPGGSQFAVAANGLVSLGVPTGPAVTGDGNINISGGYFVNGVPLSSGIPEPGTAGNWLRQVNGTNTWVEMDTVLDTALDSLVGAAPTDEGVLMRDSTGAWTVGAIDGGTF